MCQSMTSAQDFSLEHYGTHTNLLVIRKGKNWLLNIQSNLIR